MGKSILTGRASLTLADGRRYRKGDSIETESIPAAHRLLFTPQPEPTPDAEPETADDAPTGDDETAEPVDTEPTPEPVADQPKPRRGRK